MLNSIFSISFVLEHFELNPCSSKELWSIKQLQAKYCTSIQDSKLDKQQMVKSTYLLKEDKPNAYQHSPSHTICWATEICATLILFKNSALFHEMVFTEDCFDFLTLAAQFISDTLSYFFILQSKMKTRPQYCMKTRKTPKCLWIVRILEAHVLPTMGRLNHKFKCQ